jgi:hypothetical protein
MTPHWGGAFQLDQLASRLADLPTTTSSSVPALSSASWTSRATACRGINTFPSRCGTRCSTPFRTKRPMVSSETCSTSAAWCTV